MRVQNRPVIASVHAHVLLLCAAVALLIAGACSGRPTVVVHPKDRPPVRVRVEVAATDEARRMGLMYRTTLEADQGMLFVFPGEQPREFWMKNTPLSLDIIFAASDGRIVRIHERTEPYSTAPLPSGAPARYVLEVPGGSCGRWGLRTGDRLDLGRLGTRGP